MRDFEIEAKGAKWCEHTVWNGYAVHVPNDTGTSDVFPFLSTL
jgi:hypothetical protein